MEKYGRDIIVSHVSKQKDMLGKYRHMIKIYLHLPCPSTHFYVHLSITWVTYNLASILWNDWIIGLELYNDECMQFTGLTESQFCLTIIEFLL